MRGANPSSAFPLGGLFGRGACQRGACQRGACQRGAFPNWPEVAIACGEVIGNNGAQFVPRTILVVFCVDSQVTQPVAIDTDTSAVSRKIGARPVRPWLVRPIIGVRCRQPEGVGVSAGRLDTHDRLSF